MVATACITGFIAGGHVRRSANDALKKQVEQRLIKNSHMVSRTVATYFENIEGLLAIMAEAVQDRIVGYPEPGWEEDLYVPFKDRETGRNRYPLKAKPVRLDWQVKANINKSNADEHYPGRPHLYPDVYEFASSEPDYFMPGTCDPLETNPSSKNYLPNCTDINNDVKAGGIFPTPTHGGLIEKAADLAVILKSTFESNSEVSSTGFVFFNSGMSTFFTYPGANAADNLIDYESEGCEWMREINPRNGKPYGTEEDIQRCRPRGEPVKARTYNAHEQSWFAALTTSSTATWTGPFRFVNNFPMYVVGLPVFDRM